MNQSVTVVELHLNDSKQYQEYEQYSSAMWFFTRTVDFRDW